MHSKVSAMHDLAKGIDRSSVRLFWFSLIIRVSRCMVECDIQCVLTSIDTLLLEPALVAIRQRL
jgi:hypothetical protein